MAECWACSKPAPYRIRITEAMKDIHGDGMIFAGCLCLDCRLQVTKMLSAIKYADEDTTSATAKGE